jgi:hypothetical protein
MTTSEVREFLNLGSARATRVQLARWGIEAVGRDVGSGEKLWNAEQVRAARDNRPGRGARTDIKENAVATTDARVQIEYTTGSDPQPSGHGWLTLTRSDAHDLDRDHLREQGRPTPQHSDRRSEDPRHPQGGRSTH